jgi:hypothetical protein
VAHAADGQIQMERLVLTVGEAFEAIHREGLFDPALRTVLREVEQGMPAEAGGHVGYGRVDTAGLAGDLAKAGAG